MFRFRFDDSLGKAINTSVVLAAIATIPVVILEERGDNSLPVQIADWASWSVFLLEYLIGITLAPDRRAYAHRNWLSLAVIVLSFPLVPSMLALTRLVRLSRLMRLVRLAGVTAHAFGELKAIFSRQSLIYALCITVLIVIAGGAGLTLLEPQTVKGGVGDGIWWAVVTATTVGYGDIAPQSYWGRAIAVIVMMAGVGLVSTLAASITTFFVGQQDAAELQELRDRTARIEALLEELLRRGESTAPPPYREPTSSEPRQQS